ncbi:hypothetical protein BaRGS_00038471 [Batillaria attramentaria]|uniref:Uncharacterized protein n=1 Tax=Batillaria attramentaria TaxID=370345 RepID=A0ABD0J5Y5_9CAEN
MVLRPTPRMARFFFFLPERVHPYRTATTQYPAQLCRSFLSFPMLQRESLRKGMNVSYAAALTISRLGCAFLGHPPGPECKPCIWSPGQKWTRQNMTQLNWSQVFRVFWLGAKTDSTSFSGSPALTSTL